MSTRVKDAWYETEPVLFEELTLDFLQEHLDKARAAGCTNFATTTDKSAMPWKITVVFFNKEKA